MQAPQITAAAPMPQLQAQDSQDSKAPETGVFNFLDYLLGLQDTDVETMVAGEKGKAEVVADPETKGKKSKDEENLTALGLLSAKPIPTPLKLLVPVKGEVPEGDKPGKGEKGGISPNELLVSLDKSRNPISNGKSTVEESKSQAIPEPVVNEAVAKDKALQKYSQVANATPEGEKGALSKAATKSAELLTPTVSAQVATASSESVKHEVKEEKKSDRKDGEKLSSLEGLIQAGQSRSDLSASGNGGVHHAEMVAADKATVPELFNRVNTLVQQGGGKMTVSLNPPHLGQVEVQVTARGKNIEIEMKSESTHAKSLLEAHASDLRQSLQTHDLVLSKMEVNVNRDFVPHSAKFAGMMNQDTSQNSGGQFGNEGQSRFNKSFHETATVARGSNTFARTGGGNPSSGDGRVDLRI